MNPATTMPENPWASLSQPTSASGVVGRRVDPDLAWNFFWAKGTDNVLLLVMDLSPGTVTPTRLPRLRGLSVSRTPDGAATSRLMFRLVDLALQELFIRFCLDIVDVTRDKATEQEAVDAALGRTWRWHHLLRGGRDERLSVREQQGLIGELRALERFFLPTLLAYDALLAWTGPFDAPKDFAVGNMAIEVKARRGVSQPHIRISSEDQLATDGLDHLFLYVVDLNLATAGESGARTLTEVARSVYEQVQDADAGAVEQLEACLGAAGFLWDHDYADYVWLESTAHLCQVTDVFPRIVPPVPPGLSRVEYSVAIAACERFSVTDTDLISALKGGRS